MFFLSFTKNKGEWFFALYPPSFSLSYKLHQAIGLYRTAFDTLCILFPYSGDKINFKVYGKISKKWIYSKIFYG